MSEKQGLSVYRLKIVSTVNFSTINVVGKIERLWRNTPHASPDHQLIKSTYENKWEELLLLLSLLLLLLLLLLFKLF